MDRGDWWVTVHGAAKSQTGLFPPHCYVAACMSGELEGEWIHVYAWRSLSASHLKLP